MSPPRSNVWKHFTKIDHNTAACKICFKHLKTSGNTSNLAKHLKQHSESETVAIKGKTKAGKNAKQIEVDVARASPSSKTVEESVLVSPDSPVASTSTCVSLDNNDDMDCTIVVRDTNITGNKNKTTPETITTIDNKSKAISRYSRTPTIKESFKRISAYKEGGTRYAAITQNILFFICKDYMPFNCVRGAGFKKLLHELCPSYKIPHPDTFKAKLRCKYDSMKVFYEEKLNTVEHICLTFDIWTETMQTKSFLGVTAHFLKDTNLLSKCIATKQLSERHTAQYISKQLEEILEFWKIKKDNIIAVVTDNGANVVSAVTKTFGKNKHIPCFAHTINLIAEHIIKDQLTLPIIVRIRDIVKWAKRSVTVSDKFRKMQIENGIPEGNVKKLILDIPTRWNSTFYMLDRFIEMAALVNQLIIEDIDAPSMLSAADLDLSRQIRSLLNPLEFVTREACGELYVTISKIIPMLNCLKMQIQEITSDIPTIRELKTIFLAELERRFGHIEHNYFLSVATLLDPRFKKIHFRDPLGCSKSIDYLRKNLAIAGQAAAAENSSDDSTSPPRPQAEYDFWNHHKVLAHVQKQKQQKPVSNINDEFSVYISSPVAVLKSDPMAYWEEVKNIFPLLYKQAVSYFSIVATSVPSERLFSKAGATITRDRNRLSGEHLEKILFLADCDEDEWFS